MLRRMLAHRLSTEDRAFCAFSSLYVLAVPLPEATLCFCNNTILVPSEY
jgi:hypothetical protein